ncbi:MAG: DNA-directed RNA polymerase subunit beta [Gemmatimonadota bacterium]|nr:DNA-directed RNA polymerase subunit beta [Gemmatimonadota bacterium]MDP6803607.1 DNA-directed RNA polymerase subunit beta [Gemmatimonadota bacterium]MDP7032244.1 DNA-directed RNA polymerase subunit beta [Gemmatimonadota bacterium]
MIKKIEPAETNGQRHDFSRLSSVMDIPNLLAVQLDSFRSFLQIDSVPEKRQRRGLQAVFQDIFPISDNRENFTLEFVAYRVGPPKFSVEECQERDLTFAVPLKANLRLIVWDEDDPKTKPRTRSKGKAPAKDPKDRKIKNIIEQEVYLGELPFITDGGTFVINGAERVIVSQLHRSPGVFFDQEIHPNGKRLFSARIIPYRGSWVEFSLDINDIMYVHIDRRRKIPVTILLRALGYVSDEDVLRLFYTLDKAKLTKSPSKRDEKLVGRMLARDIVNEETGEVVAEANSDVTEDLLALARECGVSELLLIGDAVGHGGEIREAHRARSTGVLDTDVMVKTLRKDRSKSQEEALAKIYNLLRPGDPPSAETTRGLLDNLFFTARRYDLANVGRYKLNQRLSLDVPVETVTLTHEDFLSIIRYLVDLRFGEGFTDDIDHLGNRRIRSVGELLSNQFSVGLSRMARIIRERMSMQDAEKITPYDLINARTISAVIKTFFGSSQLSQFMDQTNPLAELTHKRRLSALGPGGLTRERAGFEVRDVHYTHYGRICPIETPEGPNIGLISSLATFARVNEFGFLETPYRSVKKGKVSDEVTYLTADVEDRNVMAQANSPLDDKGKFVGERVLCRRRGDFPLTPPDEVKYMDVSPKQLVSAAAALIPFLEHDDANRALMGSNMQRQAVPLLRTDAPLVGTGLEEKVARDSGAVVVSKRAGVVDQVSSDAIYIKHFGRKSEEEDFTGFGGLDIYRLTKFRRSNQDTCINQHPLVYPGDRVQAGQIIADGPATSHGELALGVNALTAFMPWEGYNFEDAVIVSEKLLRTDRFTSIHIEELEIQVRDTKRGPEEITKEIPNISDEAIRNLDEDGIIRLGARVHAGDILVGKVTPKGETELSPEERLLRAIFGEKAGDVRDASLKAPPGMDGVVIDVKVFSRRERDDRGKKEEKSKVDKIRREEKKRVRSTEGLRDERLLAALDGLTTRRVEDPISGRTLIRAGRKVSEKLFEELEMDVIPWTDGITTNEELNERCLRIHESARQVIEGIRLDGEKAIERITRGDELPPGVVRLVKVYIARKRKLSVGDKMAGRHGNKGVVSKIMAEEDMPHLPDGTPVEILLNPLGVPSRMNLGQILETHLGWAAKHLGKSMATPVFDGASIDEIKEKLTEAGLPTSGKTPLYDGRTGMALDNEVTVGYMYMLKLSHLVDDKIHARSIGPYSLVTQQPLGGKAQFGGQRFGEMEVWALEAYGAAHTLQELLTVKSDDVAGRSRVYEAIVKGENPPMPGIPESFNVLVKELQALALDVHLEELT